MPVPRDYSWWASLPGVEFGVKRTVQSEMALRVHMLQGRHAEDVYNRCLDEMGERAKELGPVDLSCCLLDRYVTRRAMAYRRPVYVTGLRADFAALIGDANSRSTIDRYIAAGGYPMPSVMQRTCHEALRYRLGCNYVGMAVGWSKRSTRPYCKVITPDVLEVVIDPDDPLSPSVIRHYQSKPTAAGNMIVVADEYDLSNPENPIYRVVDLNGNDRTLDVYGETFSGDLYPWRYSTGRPFHRIVVSGDPEEPYTGITLVEGTLRASTGRTAWWAGFRDASHPERNVRGMNLAGGQDSNADTGKTGNEAGPEYVRRWVDDDPDRPGEHWQWNPAFDPKVTWDAQTAYEQDQLSAMGLPVRFEQTGGEPTETERVALQEWIATTYPDCQGQDVLLFRRMAAIANRHRQETGLPEIPEGGYGCEYGENIPEPKETPDMEEETTKEEEEAT